MNDVKSLSHSKWRCKYHIVFAPKYRRQVIYNQIKVDIGKILRDLCERKGVEILEAELSWSSVFVTRVSNKLMLNTSLRMAYDSRYKNAVVHGCIWYKQNAPLRDREIPHLDTHEDKFLRSSAY